MMETRKVNFCTIEDITSRLHFSIVAWRKQVPPKRH